MSLARISSEDKQRLVNAFDNEEDYLLLADQLGIKRSTARGIVYRTKKRGGVIFLPRGGTRVESTKVDEELRSGVETILQDNPAITLVGIGEELRRRFPNKVAISRTTIARICDGLLFSVKKLHLAPADRNRQDVKEARRDYATWFLEEGQLSPVLIYIDECGYNLWTQRTRGRARTGERAVRVVGGERGRNLTLIMAISPQLGLVKASFHDGGTTKAVFQEFLESLLDIVDEPASVIFVMDNAPCHRGCHSPCTIKYLPAYSPMLNAIENAFSSWKAAVKTELARPETQARVRNRDAAAAAGETLVSWRRSILREIGERALEVITPAKCAAWHRHCLMYLPRCHDMENILH